MAAVCYRISDGKVDFLLVRTRKGRWIFPKGGVEVGLTQAESAALEALEEGGVHGSVEETPFSSYSLPKNRGTEPPVKTFLCRVHRTEPAQELYRTPTWFSETKAKLRLAENRPQADAAEFVRVVDNAISRIRRLQNGKSPKRDALQRVHFEAAASVDLESRSFIRYLRNERSKASISLPRKTAKVLQIETGSSQR